MSWKKPPSPLFIPPRPPSPHWGAHRLLLSIMARWEPLDTQVVKRLRLFSSYLFLWRLFSSYLFFWRLFSSYLFFWRLFSSYLFFWRLLPLKSRQHHLGQDPRPVAVDQWKRRIEYSAEFDDLTWKRMGKKSRVFCWMWWPQLMLKPSKLFSAEIKPVCRRSSAAETD